MSAIETAPQSDRFLRPESAPKREAEQKHDRCPECGSVEPWGEASWCPNCGYYPVLNRAVESANEGSAIAEEEERVVDHWWEAVPEWVWPLIIGGVGIVVASLIGRLMLNHRPGILAIWGGVQIITGYAIFFTAHLGAYMTASAKDTTLGPFDVFMKPREIWRYTIAKLPDTSRRVYCGAWGLTAAMAAKALLGGLDLSSITEDEWVEPQANKSVVGVVRDAAKANSKKQGPKTMNEAMNELAGDEGNGSGLELAKVKDKRTERADCLIYGYVASGGSDFDRLLLATAIKGKLQHTAVIDASSMDKEDRRKLVLRMSAHTTRQSIIRGPIRGTWLKPKFMCRVKFEKWSASKKMVAPAIDAMLADID